MKYTYYMEQAISKAKKLSKKLNHNYIGTEHLLLALLGVTESLSSSILHQAGLEETRLLALMKDLISLDTGDQDVLERDGFTPKLKLVLEVAGKEAALSHSEEVGTEHALLALIRTPDCAATRLLASLDINIQKLFQDIITSMGTEGDIYKDELMSRQSIYPMGDSSALEKFSTDITYLASVGELDPCIGRTQEMERVLQILSRRGKNNPCLIGEPGVGKTAIVEGLAQMIILGTVPENMKNKRLLSLDLSGMVAGTKYRGEFEERIKAVIDEVSSRDDILLFVDELHTLIGAGNGSGSLDAANILKPALARGDIQTIGATTISEYRKYIEKDSALERRFQPVMVEEPTKEEAKKILIGIRHRYEEHHGLSITDEAVDACVELSERYISDRFLPDKAIDVMDEAAAKKRLFSGVSGLSLYTLEDELCALQDELELALKEGRIEDAIALNKTKDAVSSKLDGMFKRDEKRRKSRKVAVTEKDVADVVSLWTKIPVAKLNESEATKLRNLEKTLHKRIVGQDDAVSALSRAVRRGRVGLKDKNRPIGSFLFLGPTGVGKTEVSKALADAIFGNEENMIRVDMSEYMEKHSVSKMIGSPPGYVGYEEGGQLSEKVRRNPYSVILFDEVEKAHPDVFNLLLQVLDDGRITDGQGRKVDFKNTIIIMTSNVGARDIIEPKKLGFLNTDDENQDFERMKGRVMDELKRQFKPEFLNRIDETIVFRALNKNDMKQIVSLMTKTLVKRCKEQMNISLTIRNDVKDLIVKEAYDPKYGARPLRRKIQNSIEDPLSDEILAKKILPGDEVSAVVSDKKIVFEIGGKNVRSKRTYKKRA